MKIDWSTKENKTQQKIKILKSKREEEISLQCSPQINNTYPSKMKISELHTHYVEIDNPAFGRNEFLDPIWQQLNMSEGKKFSELSLLQRNQLWINNKNAKIMKEVEIKRQKETIGCSFKPKLSKFDYEKLLIVPTILQDSEEKSKISSSLDRIINQNAKIK